MIAVTGVNAVNPEGANQTTLQAAQLFGQLAQTQQRIAAQQAAQAFGATTDMMRMERQADLQMQQARDRAALNYGFESFDQLTQAAGEANQDVNTFLANLDADRNSVLAKAQTADYIDRLQRSFPIEIDQNYIRAEQEAIIKDSTERLNRVLKQASPQARAEIMTRHRELMNIQQDAAAQELLGEDGYREQYLGAYNDFRRAVDSVPVKVNPIEAYFDDPTPEKLNAALEVLERPNPDGSYSTISMRNGFPSADRSNAPRAQQASVGESMLQSLLTASPEEYPRVREQIRSRLNIGTEENPVWLEPQGLNIVTPKGSGSQSGGKDKGPLDGLDFQVNDAVDGVSVKRQATSAELVQQWRARRDAETQIADIEAETRLDSELASMSTRELTAYVNQLSAAQLSGETNKQLLHVLARAQVALSQRRSFDSPPVQAMPQPVPYRPAPFKPAPSNTAGMRIPGP